MSLNVSKDSKGFDDIDKFWSAADTEVRESDSSEEDFEYDTSSSISESSEDEREEREGDESLPVPLAGLEESLQSDLSTSLTLHENEEEDTDAQEGSDSEDDTELEEEEVKEEVKTESILSSAKKKKEGVENKSRRQSKVQFDDEITSKESRRLSAPAALPVSASATKSKGTKKKKQQKNQEKEEMIIDETSPFSVGRISEIPQVNDEDDNTVSEQHHQDEYEYNDNVPFEENSIADEDSFASVKDTSTSLGDSEVRTPASDNKTSQSESSKQNKKKGKSYEYHDTPGTTPGSVQSTPGNYVKGRELPDESYRVEEDDTDDDEGLTDNGADTTIDESLVDTSYMQAARAGAIEENSDSAPSETEDSGGPRRSRRVTKGQRVQFWKNERPKYEKGRMVEMWQALPTPKKPARAQSKKKKRSSKQNKRLFDADSSDESSDDGKQNSRRKKPKLFQSKDLPSEVDYISRDGVDTYSVWDDVITAPTKTTVIHINEAAHPPTKLPITAVRPQGKDVVGVAAQSFNIPEIPQKMSGWISGFCELPPGGIKDAEGVGECCQVFQVASCQDGSVEFGLAHPSEEEWVDRLAQRTVLKARDSFYVPPGNIYRLENHSKVEPCVIYWTIIRPLDEMEEETTPGS